MADSIAPSVFQIGQTPNTMFSLTNVNADAIQEIQTGNLFTITFGIPGGSVTAVGRSVAVVSQVFKSTDFIAALGPGPNQLSLTYVGPDQIFPAQETISIAATVTVSQVGSGLISRQVPPDRFDAAPPAQLLATAVDFPLSEPGPAGPQGLPG